METYKNVSQDIRDQMNAKAEAVQIILTGIDNDIYSTVDACPNACEMWKAIKWLKQGELINVQDLETNLYWEFGKFTSRDGESLELYFSRFYKMMNELVRNQCDVTNHQVNVQFLLQLQLEWQMFVTLVKQNQELKTVSYHNLYDILKQHQNEVNELRAERIARTANLLALVAQQQPVYHPYNHPTHYAQNSSTRSQQAATRCRGKAIVNSPPPIYDHEPSTVTEDDEMSKDKEIDKLMDLISLSGVGYDNQRLGNVAVARETVEEAGIQLNAEQVDWRDDTDDESEDQELEAHYMYMAQIQEVSPDANDSGPIFDTEPMQKVSNDDHYNSFTVESDHPEQSEFVNDTYPIKQDEHNVIVDSLDMSYDREHLDHNDDDDLANEFDKLKGEIKDFKNKNKSLESSNNRFKEANNKLSETNKLMYTDLKTFQAELDRRNDVEYASKINDLNQTISEMKKKLSAHQETISVLSQAKEAHIKLYKTREDKELDKVIALENKVKVLDNIVYKTGQLVQTMNMLNTPESDKVIRLEKESRSKLSDLIRPFDYDKLNNLYDLFVPQREKSSEERYFSERSRMSHTPVNNGNSKESFNKQTTLLEKQMDESIPWDQKYSLKSKLETQKTQCLNEIDRLSREYYYADHMNAILGVYIELDEVTNLQCDYFELLEKCECLEKELSKRMYKLHTKPTQTRTTQLLNDSRKTNKCMSFSTRVIPTTIVSRPQLKSNPIEDRIMLNNSQGKNQEVEDQRRNVKFSKNKTFVTACNDSLKAKTSNVNFVCATCGKCVLNEKHDMCVLRSHNGVNSMTKMPIAVPVSTREPKRTVTQSVAKPLRKTVASESTNQKPRNITRKLYESVSKSCSWWYPKFTPPGYKWKPKSQLGNVNQNLVEIVLFIVDSRCSKHMTGNLKLLINFVEKFLGTVKFGNDQIAPILGYGDLGNDLLTGSRGTDLYSITLEETNSPNPICLMAKATSSQAWLWHRRLSHLNFDTINLLSKNDIVVGLLKACPKRTSCSKRILHQTSVARTPKQNGVVKRRIHTLVEAARTMLSAAKVLLFFWAKAIATTCFTQNRSLVITRQEKTHYHIINDRKPSVKFFHIFGSLCYIIRYGENLDKLKEKGDACIFVGYSTQSRAYRVFNKRTRVLVETIHVNFDELCQMASDHASSDPGTPFGWSRLIKEHDIRHDSDHAGCLDSRKSTSGGIQFLVLWMRTQLTYYGFHFDKIPMYCDSKAAIAISCNPVQHSHTKHINVRCHFIKEKVEKGIVELFFVGTEYQLADLFTKALPEEKFKYLVRRLGMRCLTPE
nr:Gag-Pol polyprotein [Tanacetum cinerariifolium]